MFSLVLLTALAQPVPEPVLPERADPARPTGPAAPSALPPLQVLASIDAIGNLRLTYVSPACDMPGTQERTLPLPGPDKTPARVKTTTVMVTTVELAAKHVAAHTTDGREVSPEKLATLLAKERTVLVACDGKKVDPFLLGLYKEDTLVLVPPANAFPGGYGSSSSPYAGPGGGVVLPVPAPGPIPVPPPLPPDRAPQPDRQPEPRPERQP